jgi:hypothetical protein
VLCSNTNFYEVMDASCAHEVELRSFLACTSCCHAAVHNDWLAFMPMQLEPRSPQNRSWKLEAILLLLHFRSQQA